MSVEYICEETIDIDNGVYRIDKHERIVRCRDCELVRDWFDDEKIGFDEAELTDGWCVFLRIGVDGDGFCAWAERREA